MGILVLPGKILAYCASLLCARLPVTGFLGWWGRRKKKIEKTAPPVAINLLLQLKGEM
jgi:uncharacterized iron-regulated membrane protein